MKSFLNPSFFSALILATFAQSAVAQAETCALFTEATAKKVRKQISQVIGQENGLVFVCNDCVDQEIRPVPVDSVTFSKDPQEKGDRAYNILLNGKKISLAGAFIKKNPSLPFDDQLTSLEHALGCANPPKEKELSLIDRQNFHTAFKSVFPSAEVFKAFQKCQKSLIKEEIDLAYSGIEKSGFQHDGVSEKLEEPHAYLGAGAGDAFYKIPHTLETTLSLRSGESAKVFAKLAIFAQSTIIQGTIPAIPAQPAQYDQLGKLSKPATEEIPARETRKVKLTVRGGWEDFEMSMIQTFRFKNQETGQPVMLAEQDQPLDMYRILEKSPPVCEVEIDL